MPVTIVRHVCGAALLVVALCTIHTSAAPGFWQAATQAEFLRGDLEHLSLDEHGRMRLGPRIDRIFDPSVAIIWTAVEQGDGRLFLGTGNDGRVFKVNPDGRGELFFDSAELEVHALAPASDGGLFVGTSPDGRIYKVDATGAATTFFDPEDKYIWSLAVAPDGTVYAGTGDKGTVYRITPQGEGTAFFATRTTHATTVVREGSGRLLVGTGTPGRVFRIDESGKGFLLLDTPYQEVRAIRLSPQGDVYVAAQNRPSQGNEERPEPQTDSPRPAPVPSVSTEITSITIIDVPVPPQPATPPGARDDRRGPTGGVYRVRTDGLWDLIWESREEAPYDVALEPDGGLLVATGARGKVFRLAGNLLRPTLLARVAAEQATMLRRQKDRIWLVTANPGLVLALSGEHASQGTYESDVRDARTVASWGTLSWRAVSPRGARVEMSTRSGNTRTPDEAWSEWSAPYNEADGSLITSPKARYLQWRAVLTARDESPTLTSVTAAYLQRNARPQVATITVHPPGLVFQKPFSTGETEIAGYDGGRADPQPSDPPGAPPGGGAPALGRRSFKKGLQTLAWKADDDNDDRLTFDVFYRREGETEWRPLRRGLSDPLTVWDTTSAQNGVYTVKVVASDELSHPPTAALKGELESGSFDIDNTAPVVTIGKPRRERDETVIPIEVRDEDSALRQVEYSLDTQKWQSAFPADGLLDAREEKLEIRLGAAAGAGQNLVIRATDMLYNVGGGHVVLPR